MGSIKKVNITETFMKSQSESHGLDPRDFENFIPWLCVQFDLRNISVKKYCKAEYQRATAKKSNKKSLKSTSVGASQELSKNSSTTQEFMRSLGGPMSLADHVIISAYYDTSGVLVEIAFNNCVVPVPREIFMIIQLCLPYNPNLTRLTWKGARLTSILVYEISKLITGSELTEVVFEGCYVPQANYYILLDKATKLKYLSLTNCEINDEVCVMIAERIKRHGPAAENLLALDLASNRITDVGAEALGHSLRTNRRLLYLNLCNNEISSAGAAHILLPLTRFKLSDEENMDMQLLKMKLIKQKLAGKEEKHEIKEEKSKLKRKVKGRSYTAVVETETQVNFASSGDDFLATAKEEKKGSWYSAGNLTLCALNLAYNRLDWATVSRIADVVSYQYSELKRSKTGLLRVVIEGNPLPETCVEYELISKYIDLAIAQPTPYSQSTHVHLVRSKSRTSRLNSAQTPNKE